VTRRVLAATLAATYVGTIVAANWLVQHLGAVPVGLGLLAPAGVYMTGLAFTLRDLLHEVAGRWAVLVAILTGAVLSALIAPPAIALASAVAFGTSELADMAVYTPLRERRRLTAVAVSNLVGLTVDSALFLRLAFGSLQFLPGQIVGKAWMTALAVIVLAGSRAALRARRAEA
jgi:hypothetical protein